MIGRVFLTVCPLVVIVAAGYLYGRKREPDTGFANRVNMDIFTPALIFDVLAVREFELGLYQGLALAGALVVLGSALTAYPVLKGLRLDCRNLLPSMMFNNSGNLGIPLAVLAFGEPALPAAVILWVVEMSLHMTLGVYMLDRRFSLARFIRTPMILAAMLGIGFSYFELAIPEALGTAVSMLGQVSIPLMLVTLGIRMATVRVDDWGQGLVGGILCPLSGLVVALLINIAFPLPAQQLPLLILFSVLPPALMNYMLAERYNQAPQRVASVVIVGNLVGLVVIPCTLLFL
ncbi:transporter [Marinobacterium aestuarii]|uniref:Transporter n=1 Tax=Marinobacterium aestuarii TaxID=1821621 RepID=A0A1A9F4J7_9GAMM|nr:transporter [Marinobacterium aestuarii]